MREIYELMDTDMDGMISAEKIEISTLEPKELDILTPLLVELEDSEREWSFIDFVTALETYLPKMNVDERNCIVGPPHRTERAAPSEPQFQP